MSRHRCSNENGIVQRQITFGKEQADRGRSARRARICRTGLCLRPGAFFQRLVDEDFGKYFSEARKRDAVRSGSIPNAVAGRAAFRLRHHAGGLPPGKFLRTRCGTEHFRFLRTAAPHALEPDAFRSATYAETDSDADAVPVLYRRGPTAER